MTSTNNTAGPARCLGCRRPIRAAESLATGYGAGCRAKIRKAARTADLSAWTESQIEDARQAIEDDAVVPSNREGVFHVVGSDGTEVHLVHSDRCNCEHGLKTHQSRPCYHRCAVAIVLAPSAPAPRPAPAPVAISAPAPAPVATPDDVWAALEAVGALDLVPAF